MAVLATLAEHRMMDYWYHTPAEGVPFRPQICRTLHRKPLVNITAMTVESFFSVCYTLEHLPLQTPFSFFFK